MRDFLLPIAALAATVPGAAWADDGCPQKAGPDLITALGAPAATLTATQAIYQPAGATMLGLPVSYVVVTKGSGGAIEEIDYRFDGIMRKYSERVPQNVLRAFDKTYADAGCASGRVSSCSIAFQSNSPKAGDLAAAEITDPAIDVPAKAEGTALTLVKADYAREDQGPVFLVCLYDTGS